MLIKFEIYNDGEYWCGRCTEADIFTQGKTLDELVLNIKDAVSLHFEDVIKTGKEIKIISISEFEVSSIT